MSFLGPKTGAAVIPQGGKADKAAEGSGAAGADRAGRKRLTDKMRQLLAEPGVTQHDRRVVALRE